MRILVVSICSLALFSMADGAQKQENKPQPKKQPQPAHHVNQPAAHAAGGAGTKKMTTASSGGQKHQASQSQTAVYHGQKAKNNQTQERQAAKAANERQAVKAANQRQAAKAANERQATKATNERLAAKAANERQATKTTNERLAAKAANAGHAQGKPLKPQHFNLPKQPNTAKAPPVKFQQGRRIQGSQNWQGQRYAVFRNYKSEWHDRSWWHNHYHNNITFVFGAPYYWNAGYWFPAWGYTPNAYYAWDGPIYGYNRMPPDQVTANVQAALQQQGYYHGEVDGLIGPLTRGAIADYQRDHGLYTTSTIDQPTLQSLGIA